MFIGPPLTGVPAALYVGVVFLIAASGYALYEVPYKAMPAEMTHDYHERTSLLQWRMIFIALGIAMSGILAPILAGDTVEGYRLMGIVFGGVAAGLDAGLVLRHRQRALHGPGGA